MSASDYALAAAVELARVDHANGRKGRTDSEIAAELDYSGGPDGVRELGERYRAWRGELDDIDYLKRRGHRDFPEAAYHAAERELDDRDHGFIDEV